MINHFCQMSISSFELTVFLSLFEYQTNIFQAPYWVTPFMVPVISRTKVGDPSLVHLTMSKKQETNKKQQTNKQTNQLNIFVYRCLVYSTKKGKII